MVSLCFIACGKGKTLNLNFGIMSHFGQFIEFMHASKNLQMEYVRVYCQDSWIKFKIDHLI